MERLHCRIPAALGFVCGLLRRVGGSAVFGVYLFLFFFIFCSRQNGFFSHIPSQNSQLLPPQYFCHFRLNIALNFT
jgi:hypothetical protein